MKCRCASDKHGHKPGKCENLATESHRLCKPCHDAEIQQIKAASPRGTSASDRENSFELLPRHKKPRHVGHDADPGLSPASPASWTGIIWLATKPDVLCNVPKRRSPEGPGSSLLEVVPSRSAASDALPRWRPNKATTSKLVPALFGEKCHCVR